MSHKQTRASFPYLRVTRASRLARARASAAESGHPIQCSRPDCPYIVPPSFVGGTEEYWCHNNNHGRIAMRIDGRLEFLPPADPSVQPRPRGRLRKYVPCASRGCSSKRRSACSRGLCWSHCVGLEGRCGCREHDRERERRTGSCDSLEPARAVPRSSHRDRASYDRDSEEPTQRAPGGSHRGHVARTPSPPRVARMPPLRPVPDWVEVSMWFTDTGFRAKAHAPRKKEGFMMHTMDADLAERLRMNEKTHGSLRYLDLDGTWREPRFAMEIPYFQDLGDDDAVYIYLRAESTAAVVAEYFADLSSRAAAYRRFTADRKHPMPNRQAFTTLFDFEPTPTNLEQVEKCLTVVETSPPQLREKFEHAGRTPKGTWIEFVRQCERHKDTPTATRILCQSPLVRQGVRESPGSLAAQRAASLSPDLGASPGPSTATRLSPDLGASPGPSSPEQSSPGPPAWRGPPASEASSSGYGAAWDDDDDLYD